MYSNYLFDTASEALPFLLSELDQAPVVESRAGKTKEMTHVSITLQHPWRREILVHHRKPSIAAQIAETMWVISGQNDIGWLANYLPRALDFSDDGKTWRAGYGKRIRRWTVDGAYSGPVDQLAYVVNTLQRDPGSRQAVISIWDPIVDTKPGKDIPCNDWLSFSIRDGRLDLMVAIRSNDAIWGWSGINAFEWSALQEIVAGLVGAEMGSLHFATTSFHTYEHHWSRNQKITEQVLTRGPVLEGTLADAPRFNGATVNHYLSAFDELADKWFLIEKMLRAGEDASSLVELFPEPMLQSWLRVLQWWWSGNMDFLEPLEGTRLEVACKMSVQPPERVQLLGDDRPIRQIDLPREQPETFIQHVISTHNEKHAAYGDSWKRRGEMLGIMANIARKIDRLGGSETSDETSADTAMDLFVYLCKYRVWLDEQVQGPIFRNWGGTEHAGPANEVMLEVSQRLDHEEFETAPENYRKYLEDVLRGSFDRLEDAVTRGDRLRWEIVKDMMNDAYRLAVFLWGLSQPDSEDDGSLDQYLGADVD